MRAKIVLLLLILLPVAIGGCIDTEGAQRSDVQIENNADVPVEVTVALVPDHETVSVEHRNGTEAEYAIGEVQQKTSNGLNEVSVGNEELVGRGTAETGETSEIDIEDYDGGSYVLIIVNRTGETQSMNVVTHRCQNAKPRVTVDVGENVIRGTSKTCIN